MRCLSDLDAWSGDMTREQPVQGLHPDKLSGSTSDLLTYR